MEFAKLLDLFNKEKTRLQTNVFDFIHRIKSDDNAQKLFDLVMIINVNSQINHTKIIAQEIPFYTNNLVTNYEKFTAIQEPEVKGWFKETYDSFINMILQTTNSSIFKLVFGNKSSKDWIITMYKGLMLEYFASKNLQYPSQYVDDLTPFYFETFNETLVNMFQKRVFNVKFFNLDSIDYWEAKMGATTADFNKLQQIVRNCNPAIPLTNLVLKYFSRLKSDIYEKAKVETHKVNNYEGVVLQPNYNKTLQQYPLNYFASLTLINTFNFAIWKAIENLSFGTEIAPGKIALARTISTISVEVSTTWKLSKQALEQLVLLSYIPIFNTTMSDFNTLLNTPLDTLFKQIQPLKVKYEKILLADGFLQPKNPK